jgi:protein-S-isoprenylcysteine O-methyltransferase Ste14
VSQPNLLKSYGFVFVQFACLGLFAITGPLFPDNSVLLIVELLGILIGVWAVFTIGLGRFNITPDPLESSRLVTQGPYSLIRHPMYLALVTTGLILVRAVLWVILLVDLLLKLNYEEGLLSVQIKGYSEYRQKSYRLIPLIY